MAKEFEVRWEGSCPPVRGSHALALAKLTPIVDGGLEVRPPIGFHVEAG